MRRAVLTVLSTIAGLVLLLSFKTHGVQPVAAPPAALSSGSGTASTGTSSSGTSSPSSTSSTSSSTSTATKTVTGSSVDTRYGPVQVKITLTNGKITAATAVDYPQNDPRDEEINSSAVPTLQQETVNANSAQIDSVSGATYTSEGYISSLQSALDQVR